MPKKSDKSYINTTIDSELLRKLRIKAAERGLKINTLLEEAILDLFKKLDEGK